MAITINTNTVASAARLHLQKNTNLLERSLSKLSSGSKLVRSSDDPGGLAVSMKLSSAINRQKATASNIQNAMSFAQMQDSDLQAAARIVDRMAMLRSMYDDVTKSSQDKATYNAEFQSLRVQLYVTSQGKFNGVSLFSSDPYNNYGSSSVIEVLTSDQGEAGSKVSVAKLALLSMVTVLDSYTGNTSSASRLSVGTFTGAKIISYDATDKDIIKRSLALNPDQVSNLSDEMGTEKALVSLGAFGVNSFILALQNIATLRAENGAIQSRLEFAHDHIQNSRLNLEAANSRIMDTDIAEESSNFARMNILVQAGASMLSQANSSKAAVMQMLML